MLDSVAIGVGIGECCWVSTTLFCSSRRSRSRTEKAVWRKWRGTIAAMSRAGSRKEIVEVRFGRRKLKK
jgi:hypothetical protein